MHLTIGGDHSCAIGSVYGSYDAFGENLKLLWIDAHSDINTLRTSPSQNFHGMPVSSLLGLENMNEIKEFGWKNKNFPIENLVFLGIRDIDEGEKEILKELNIKYYTPYDIDENGGIKNVMKQINEYLKLDDPLSKLHVSFDVDVCCSSYLEGTGTKVDYGVSKREMIYIM